MSQLKLNISVCINIKTMHLKTKASCKTRFPTDTLAKQYDTHTHTQRNICKILL